MSADVHEVVFKHSDFPDLEVGRIDFSHVREVIADWPEDGTLQR
jgi:hypothetical protein